MRILFFILGIFIVFCLLHLAFRSSPLRRPDIVSHRGAGGLAPENTLAGIKVALEHQVGLAEVDVRRSQDGVLLLLHDQTVNRTTNGQGAVHTLAWPALQELDAGSHFAAEFAGSPIPALTDVLTFIQNKPITLVIELKDTALYPGIEAELAAAIKQHQLEKQVIFISFQQNSLQLLSQIMPEVAQGILAIYPINLDSNASKKASDERLVSIYWPSVILDPTLVHRLHQDSYRVWVWTVNPPWLMRLLFWLGVDGMTTDRPDLALAILAER